MGSAKENEMMGRCYSKMALFYETKTSYLRGH